jgi:hypothetical protein
MYCMFSSVCQTSYIISKNFVYNIVIIITAIFDFSETYCDMKVREQVLALQSLFSCLELQLTSPAVVSTSLTSTILVLCRWNSFVFTGISLLHNCSWGCVKSFPEERANHNATLASPFHKKVRISQPSSKMVLSRDRVFVDGVWIGNWIYSTLINRNYNNYAAITNSHTLQFTTACTKSS